MTGRMLAMHMNQQCGEAGCGLCEYLGECKIALLKACTETVGQCLFYGCEANIWLHDMSHVTYYIREMVPGVAYLSLS